MKIPLKIHIFRNIHNGDITVKNDLVSMSMVMSWCVKIGQIVDLHDGYGQSWEVIDTFERDIDLVGRR